VDALIADSDSLPCCGVAVLNGHLCGISLLRGAVVSPLLHHARPRPRHLQVSEAILQQAIVVVSETAIFLCDPPVLCTSTSAEGSLEHLCTLDSDAAAGAGVFEVGTASTGSAPSAELPDESPSESSSCSAMGCGGRAHLCCAGCLSACYCSKTCQSAHWKEHRKPCRAIAGGCAASAAV
jgi:hypothetical protein